MPIQGQCYRVRLHSWLTLMSHSAARIAPTAREGADTFRGVTAARIDALCYSVK
jgi:hypothetical protein